MHILLWARIPRWNGITFIINKRVCNAVLRCNLKNHKMICLFPRQTIQHHSNSSLCPNHLCWKIWSWSVLWRPPRTNSKKNYILFIMDWNVKARSQKIPGVTGKFDLGVQNKAGKRLTKFCQESSLVIANTLFLNNTRDNFACQHHQIVNARIRLIAFF